MHYYVQQQLLTAIRLSISELERNKPDFDGIADLLDECSGMVKQEKDELRRRINCDSDRTRQRKDT